MQPVNIYTHHALRHSISESPFFETAFTACNSRVQVFNSFDGKTIALQSQTSPGKAGKRFSSLYSRFAQFYNNYATDNDTTEIEFLRLPAKKLFHHDYL